MHWYSKYWSSVLAPHVRLCVCFWFWLNLHLVLLCSHLLCSSMLFNSLLCSRLLSLPHSVAGAAVMSVPQGEIHITPRCTLHQLCFQTTTVISGSATILHGPVEIRCVFTSMSWGCEGEGGETDRWIWMVLPSPLLPRPVNIRRSTEVGRTVIVLIIIWFKCWETLHSTSILMTWYIYNCDLLY